MAGWRACVLARAGRSSRSAAGGWPWCIARSTSRPTRLIALKLLPPSWGTPDLRVRLERQEAALRQLDHPNIVRLLEVGAVDERLGGGLYLAMEWAPQALDRVLRARYPQPLAPTAALQIARDVAGGLRACMPPG